MRFEEFDRAERINRQNARFQTFRLFWLLSWKTGKTLIDDIPHYLKVIAFSLIFLILIILVQMTDKSRVQNKLVFNPVNIDNLDKFNEVYQAKPNRTALKVWFKPNLYFYKTLIATAVKKLNITEYAPLPDNMDIKPEEYFAIVEFEAKTEDIREPPQKLIYSIRFPAMFRTDPNLEQHWLTCSVCGQLKDMYARYPSEKDETDYMGIPPGYLQEGFIALQHAIFKAYLELKTNVTKLPRIALTKFPERRYVYNRMFRVIESILPIPVVCTYIFHSYLAVKKLTEENSCGIVQVMGINKPLNWLSWLLYLFFAQLLIAPVVIFFLHTAWTMNFAIFEFSESLMIFYFLACYTISNVTFLFLIAAAIIPNPRLAVYSILANLMTLIPAPLVFVFHYNLPFWGKLCFCLFHNTGLAFGIHLITNLEQTGDGLKANTMGTQLFTAQSLSVRHVCFVLLASSVLHLMVAAYHAERYKADYQALALPKSETLKKCYYPLINLIKMLQAIWRRVSKMFSFTQLEHYLPEPLTTKQTASQGALADSDSDSLSSFEEIENVGESRLGKRQPKAPKQQLAAVMSTRSIGTQLDAATKVQMRLEARRQAEAAAVEVEAAAPELSESESFDADDAICNEPLENVTQGIQLINVSKSYKGTKYLGPTTMNIHPNEITAILGNQLSRKLMLAHTILGTIKTSLGQVIIDGIDIRNKVKGTRIAHLPKHITVLKDLSARENLYFFTHMRGWRNNGQNLREVAKYLDKLNAYELIDEPLKNCPYALMRLVSLCCALCAGRHAIICDEPTLGLSMPERHQMWQIMLSERATRAIIITTRSCEEAEILADRIAVLHRGYLQCYDRTHKILRRFCNKYLINITLADELNANVHELMHIMHAHIPEEEVQLVKLSENELEISVPASRIKSYAKLLNRLEEYIPARSITMHQQDLRDALMPEHMVSTERSLKHNIRLTEQDIEQTRKIPWALTFLAIAHKKLLYLQKSWYIPMLLALLVVLTVYCTRTDFSRFLPKRTLIVSAYERSISIMKTGNISQSEFAQAVASSYITYQNELLQRRQNQHEFRLVKGRRTLPVFLLNNERDSKEVMDNIYLTAVEIDAHFFNCYYNNRLLHAGPISLGLLHNAILLASSHDDAEIVVSNHPMPFDAIQHEKTVIAHFQTLITLGAALALSCCTAISLFVQHIIGDQQLHMRQLQYIATGSKRKYWLCVFLADFLLYALFVIIILVCLVMFDKKPYDDLKLTGVTLLELLLFGAAVLPFVYLICNYFKQIDHGFFVTLALLINTSFTLGLTVHYMPTTLYMSDMSNILYTFHWSPAMTMYLAIRQLRLIEMVHEACSKLYQVPIDKYGEDCLLQGFLDFKRPGIGINIIIHIIQFIVYFRLLIRAWPFNHAYWQHLKNFLSHLRPQCRKQPPRSASKEESFPIDSSVHAERRHVKALTAEQLCNYPLVLRNMSKQVEWRYCKDISIAVRKQEILGLVGLTGAGKAVTLGTIAGFYKPDSGSVYYYGRNVHQYKVQCQLPIGYCPNENALFNYMTMKQIVNYYCALRGRSQQYRKEVVPELMEQLKMNHIWEMPIPHMIPAEKRKLCILLAIISAQDTILLDEPTRGMDAKGIDHIWNIIKLLQKAGYTIILSSDRIHECMSICDRIGFLLSGRLLTMDTTSRLKKKYSRGCFIMMYLRENINYYEDKYNWMGMADARPKSMAFMIPTPSVASGASSGSSSNSSSSADSAGSIKSRATQTQRSFEETDSKVTRCIKRAPLYEHLQLFMRAELPKLSLQAECCNYLVYYAPLKVITLSEIFELFEGIRAHFQIIDYKIKRTTFFDFFEELTTQRARHWQGNY